jgi:hypothetical protein
MTTMATKEGKMASWSKLLFYTALVTAVFGDTMAQGGAKQLEGGPSVVALSLSAVEDTVKLGSMLRVKVKLTNKSAAEIPVWSENGEPGTGTYQVDVRDEKGDVAPETTSGHYHNGHHDLSNMSSAEFDTNGRFLQGSGAELEFKPGQTFTFETVVNRLYKISEPGKYVIRVSMIDPVSRRKIESNTVVVRVTP